jgi:hypothetical protein
MEKTTLQEMEQYWNGKINPNNRRASLYHPKQIRHGGQKPERTPKKLNYSQKQQQIQQQNIKWNNNKNDTNNHKKQQHKQHQNNQQNETFIVLLIQGSKN